jgi:oxygen-independent coproporphyrinogen-3 oxidase
VPLVTPPLALYVHFPWCVSKCPYCDFNSHALQGELPESRYVEALERDIAAQAPFARGRPVSSVFLGGGTPSLFAPKAVERVLEAARRHLGWEGDIEVTLEANPATIERGRFAEYSAAGVNRVSLGGQSFDADTLKRLGRIHVPGDTVLACEELHAAGLTNFNIDLMYALPAQDVAGAMRDIQQAIALAPAHVSHYQLTVEHGTLFAAAPPVLPNDDVAAEMLVRCADRLSSAGFTQYEVSAYARNGARSVHNLNYWHFGDYLGVGAGAHGKLTLPDGGIVRTVRLREPRRYLAARLEELEQKPVPKVELPFEFMLNALRLVDGFHPALFEERTGLAWHTVAATVESLQAAGRLQLEAEHCRPTELGLRFLNDSLVAFLPEKPLPPRVSALSTG